MANERMVPLLPCDSAALDAMAAFWVALGFTVTHRQLKPNPYLALHCDGMDLHYFGLPDFRPEDSYGSCLILVPDTEPLFETFAAGLRAAYGKLPLAGFPRITRPRRRKNAANLSGFSLVDPSGNWIRVVNVPVPDGSDRDAVPSSTSRLAQAVANAVVLADSRGDVGQAAKILSGALDRDDPDTSAVDRVEALVFLAELCTRLGDPPRAHELLDQAEATPVSAPDREALASVWSQIRVLRDY